MYPLENRILEYAWGSKTIIAELLGEPSPSARPQAELWMGAHPKAPSRAERNGAWHSLLDLIASNPGQELGPAVVSKFGPSLPFLFKVLAAEAPLSLQAHPNAEQARAGFEADERAQIPLGAPQRNYQDPCHKPELLCALGPFEALSGFRRAGETRSLLQAVAIEPLEPGRKLLERQPDSAGLRGLFSWIMATGGQQRSDLVGATLRACERHRDLRGPFAEECTWALHLATLYRGDVGVVVALLLNLVHLEAGQAIYLPAGNLHTYLRGTGIEIMANSDNVLRGGLTAKHVNVPELLRVLDFGHGPIEVLIPVGGDQAEQTYETPATEFRLSRITTQSGRTFRATHRRGPEILLCIDGEPTVHTDGGNACPLARGRSMFVPASAGEYQVSGAATLYRASVGWDEREVSRT